MFGIGDPEMTTNKGIVESEGNQQDESVGKLESLIFLFAKESVISLTLFREGPLRPPFRVSCAIAKRRKIFISYL